MAPDLQVLSQAVKVQGAVQHIVRHTVTYSCWTSSVASELNAGIDIRPALYRLSENQGHAQACKTYSD